MYNYQVLDPNFATHTILMKRLSLFVLSPFLVVAAILVWHAPAREPQTQAITWLTWQEAVEANKKAPKIFMVDVYTDWCHWCKVMDSKTFSEDRVAKAIGKDFYAVKLNAEQRDDIAFNGHTFKFVAEGRRGYHELAASMLEGKMSYPSIVYFTPNFERILVSPGYKEPDAMLTELSFVQTGAYTTTNFESYRSTYKVPAN